LSTRDKTSLAQFDAQENSSHGLFDRDPHSA
jgi:hypothetical protein